MAASAKFTIRHTDASATKKNSESFNCDPAKINVTISSDTATVLDTFARALTNLSTDTYTDSEISQVVSLNEILANNN